MTFVRLLSPIAIKTEQDTLSGELDVSLDRLGYPVVKYPGTDISYKITSKLINKFQFRSPEELAVAIENM